MSRGELSSNEVAIKQLFLTNSEQPGNDDALVDFIHEASMLHTLRDHPCLVRLFGIAVIDNVCCMITEFCSGGSLWSSVLHYVGDSDEQVGTGSGSGIPPWRATPCPMLRHFPARPHHQTTLFLPPGT